MFSAAFVAETAIGVFKMAVQLGGGAGEGGFDVGGLVGDDERRMAFWAGFEETAFVAWTRVFVGLPGEVHLDAGEVGFETTKYVDDVGSDGIGEFVVH